MIDINNIHTIDDGMDVLTSSIISELNKVSLEHYVPISTKHAMTEGWMTNNLTRCSRKQLKLYTQALKSRNTEDYDKYRKYRDTFRKLKRYCKMNYYVKKCQELRTNTRKLWEMVNCIIGKVNDRRGVISKLKIDNIEVSNSEVIANSMASFYSSVGIDYAKRIQSSKFSISSYLEKIKRNEKSLFVTPTNESEIVSIIDKPASKNSAGRDCISNRIVKYIKHEIVSPLTKLINKSLELGVFPDSMKLAYITPLYKSGSECLNTNYRPISLLPVLSKVFEKVMYSRIYNFLQSTNQLFESQYGFRKHHSCENAVQELLSVITKGFDCKEYTAALFLDLSKAFDTLDHHILLCKLELYSIRGLCLDWLKHYLTNRRLSVKCIAGEPPELSLSDEYPLQFGVPKGSCLGPLLFLIYCNDLPLNLDFRNSILFVDDTTLYKSHRNLVYLKWCIQEEMNQLLDWFRANKLTLNLNKSVCMFFHERGKVVNFEIEVDNLHLNTVKCCKFLGIWINDRLNGINM